MATRTLARSAADALRRAGANQTVRKRVIETLMREDIRGVLAGAAEPLVGMKAESLARVRSERRAAKRADREHQDLAIRTAQQIRGQWSERTVINGQYRFVAWKNATPFAVYPPLDPPLSREELCSLPELSDVPPEMLRHPPHAGDS